MESSKVTPQRQEQERTFTLGSKRRGPLTGVPHGSNSRLYEPARIHAGRGRDRVGACLLGTCDLIAAPQKTAAELLRQALAERRVVHRDDNVGKCSRRGRARLRPTFAPAARLRWGVRWSAIRPRARR